MFSMLRSLICPYGDFRRRKCRPRLKGRKLHIGQGHKGREGDGIGIGSWGTRGLKYQLTRLSS